MSPVVCEQIHTNLKTKQTKTRIYTHKLPPSQTSLLSSRSSYLRGIKPRWNTEISDSTDPQTKLILSPCKLCLIPRVRHHHPLACTSQLPWSPSVVFLVPHLPYPVSQPVMSIWPSDLSSSLQSHRHCFSWGQGFIIFLQAFKCFTWKCWLSSALLAFGRVSLQTFLHQLPAWSIQRAVLTLSSPCLRSIRASLLPKVVVLKMWCLDRQHQHHQGTCQRYRFSGPTIECLLNQTLCWWGPALCLNKPSKGICCAKFKNHY